MKRVQIFGRQIGSDTVKLLRHALLKAGFLPISGRQSTKGKEPHIVLITVNSIGLVMNLETIMDSLGASPKTKFVLLLPQNRNLLLARLVFKSNRVLVTHLPFNPEEARELAFSLAKKFGRDSHRKRVRRQYPQFPPSLNHAPGAMSIPVLP